MTHSTPQPVGDRLKHGPLSGQNLALLKAGDWLLIDGKNLRQFERMDEDWIVATSSSLGHRPEDCVFLGHDADDWIHAPEGGWTENPVPGQMVDYHWVGPSLLDHTGIPQLQEAGGTLSDMMSWRDIIAFRPAATPATREDGASGADGEREALTVDGLAQEIRRVDGNHDLGAGALAEALMPLLSTALRPLSPDQPSARERRLEEALRGLLEWADSNICTHKDTHRGGVLWTICDDCGAKWADDTGGKPPHKDPREVSAARQALAHNQEGGR